MNAEELLRHFERVAEAPGAIPRLRRFVLDVAVRGRLVSQESGDESAPLLLRRIEQAKYELIRAGQLRQPRDRDIGSTELDKPFELPPSWAWVRLDAVGAIIGGGTPPAGDAGNFADPGQGTPWLTPADLGGRKGLYVSRGARDLSEEGLRSSSATVMPAGSVLFTSRAPIGYVAIASNPVATNQGFKSVVPYLMECSRYVAMVLRAFAPEIDAKAPGTTFKEVSGKIVAGVPFPLPPLAEQHRIVAKVDELMALCDRLEAARAEREAARDRLTAASLARLNTRDPETFSDDARFAFDTFRELTARSDQVALIRQAVLNLALRGQLVKIDAADGSGLDVLAQVAAERDELVTQGVIRREAPLAPIQDADVPFELPRGWSWVRIGSAVLFTQYGTSQKAAASASGVPVLTMGNIQSGTVVPDSPKRIPEESEELPALYLKKFDLLYNRTNSAELVGKTGIFLGQDDTATFASYLIRLRPSVVATDPHFLNLAMNTSDFRTTQIVPLIKKQTGQANVNGSALKNMLIPMPSLAMQKRIVSKVAELMSLCDRIERGLIDTADRRTRLLEALLHHALKPMEVMEAVE